MHKIGEVVLYGGYGVMRIEDIREETVGDVARRYYVLSACGASASASLTFVPADNRALVLQMRPLLTRDEVILAIREHDSVADIEWVRDNRVRSERFRTVLESGDRALIMAMIRTIRAMGEERQKEGKKNYLSDENILKKAEKLIYSEFSTVLGIPEYEIPDFIETEKKNK